MAPVDPIDPTSRRTSDAYIQKLMEQFDEAEERSSAPIQIGSKPSSSPSAKNTPDSLKHAKKKTLRQRQIEMVMATAQLQQPHKKISARAQTAAKAIPYLKGGAKALDSFANSVKSLRDQSKFSLIEHAKQHFRDVTTQHAVLAFVQESLNPVGADKLLYDSLEEAKNHLMSNDGMAIRAGYNVAQEAAKAAGEGLGNSQQLADLYRQVVSKHEQPIDLLNTIRLEFSEDNLEQGLAFMVKASGADLAAEDTSIAKPKLTSLMESLRTAQTISRVNKRLQSTLATTASTSGHSAQISAEKLTYALFELTQQAWPSAEQFKAFADQAYSGEETLQARINLLTAVVQELQVMPETSFPTPDKLTQLQTAAQEALDSLIAIEGKSPHSESL